MPHYTQIIDIFWLKCNLEIFRQKKVGKNYSELKASEAFFMSRITKPLVLINIIRWS